MKSQKQNIYLLNYYKEHWVCRFDHRRSRSWARSSRTRCRLCANVESPGSMWVCSRRLLVSSPHRCCYHQYHHLHRQSLTRVVGWPPMRHSSQPTRGRTGGCLTAVWWAEYASPRWTSRCRSWARARPFYRTFDAKQPFYFFTQFFSIFWWRS